MIKYLQYNVYNEGGWFLDFICPEKSVSNILEDSGNVRMETYIEEIMTKVGHKEVVAIFDKKFESENDDFKPNLVTLYIYKE